MSELSTRIQLKRDLAANWNAVSSEFTLLSGELGFETDTGLVKIGIGKTWGETPYIKVDNISSVYGLEAALAGVQEAAIAATENTVSVYTDVALSDITDGKNTGDIAIIKTTFADGKLSYTAYDWNAADSKWEAMDGNYSAKNVYFDEDVTFAGNYTLGNKKTTNADTYVVPKGTSVEEMMKDVFTKELFPTKPTPSTTVTLGAQAKEVGEKATPTFTTTFDAKTYPYGSNTNTAKNSTTGAAADAYTITYSCQGSTVTLTGDWKTTIADDEITVVDGTNCSTTKLTTDIEIPAEGTYVPLTNTGNQCLSARVTATTATATNNNTITGWRRCFWGYRTVAEGALDIDDLIASGDLSSATIRNDIHATANRTVAATTAGYTKSSEAGIQNFTVLAGTKQLIFAVPHDWQTSLKTIKLNSSSAGDLQFDNDNKRLTTANLKIYGTTTDTVAKQYDIWYYTAEGSFAADTAYTVKFTA